MPACDQCGKPAIASANQLNLCVDCLYKLQWVQYTRQMAIAQQINFLLDQAEAVTGLYGVSPRMQMPAPPTIVQGGRMTFNNIRVDRSVVGAINTGEVQRIDVALTNIRFAGNEELASALRDFTEAVLATNELSQQLKNDLLGQISFLSEQVRATAKQAPGVLKTVMGGVASGVSTVASLVSLWEKLEPLLARSFGM